MKLFITLALALITNFMTAQHMPKPSVDVSGEGIVNVTPDQVTVSVRVEHTGNDAKEVKLKNDRIINDVLKFVKRMGIEEKHVRTEYIRLSKNYEYNTKKYNYAANQSVSIKVVDLSNYEELMNGLLETGINRIDGISFSSSRQEELESEARKKAMANAKLKATEYASVLDQSIGKALQISEFQKVNTPSPVFRSMAMADASESSQTIAPGEMQITVKVNVSFELN
ncbi:MAG: SIMPL domain-containing protein [Flavobacteriaceae bacterium]|nr:SIMPL domain-containing protein [Flavobacteriaceae bacterium]